MSLAKIPLVIGITWAFRKAITPPNPPPKDTDAAIPSNFMEMRWYTQKTPYYAKRLQYFAALVEIATILATNFPSSAWSKTILKWVVWNTGNPSNLQLHPLVTLGGIMMISGGFLRWSTYRYLGKLFKFEASIQKDHRLVTSGPYSVVRHPSYTGLLLTHPGWFLWQLGEGSWVRESGLLNTVVGKAVVGSYAVIMIMGTLYLTLGRMTQEDKALRKHFGKEWDDWASKVRYQVIPGIW